MVAKRFGVSVDEITRDREIVPEIDESKKGWFAKSKTSPARYLQGGRINQCIDLVQGDNRTAVPREPQTNPLRKRKRGKVFTAADTTPIQARIPNAMFLEIERVARHEFISIADFMRAALLEKLKRERDKNET
jgi:hypothetical protein